MNRKFVSPAVYVQGAGALNSINEEFADVDAERGYVLGGATALSITEEDIVEEMTKAGLEVTAVATGVERCTRSRIQKYTQRVNDNKADFIIGVGGGVAMDIATAVAHRTGALLAVIPTVASTDAPTSAVSVIYDDNGDFLDVIHRDRNPEFVLVDTSIIADAPAEFLAHGMGDAMATRFEAQAVAASGKETDAGGRTSFAAINIADCAYSRIIDYGTNALTAVERNAVTPAVERIVEANILLSGIGFESAGTAGAHAIQIGLTNIGVRKPHGLLVAFGMIAELIIQDADPKIIETVVDTIFEFGLDTSLEEMEISDESINQVAIIAHKSGMSEEPADPSVGQVTDAIRAADQLILQRRRSIS